MTIHAQESYESFDVDALQNEVNALLARDPATAPKISQAFESFELGEDVVVLQQIGDAIAGGLGYE